MAWKTFSVSGTLAKSCSPQTLLARQDKEALWSHSILKEVSSAFDPEEKNSSVVLGVQKFFT